MIIPIFKNKKPINKFVFFNIRHTSEYIIGMVYVLMMIFNDCYFLIIKYLRSFRVAEA